MEKYMTERTECYNDGRTPGYWKNHTERWDDGFGEVCPLGHTVELDEATDFEAPYLVGA